MNNSNIRNISLELNNIENKIINGDHSNTTTMIYFATLSKYYYYGGKSDLISRLTKSGILDTQSTNQAKQSYINIAKTYVFGGQLKLRISKSFKNTKADLFGIGKEDIYLAVNKIKKFALKNDITVIYFDKDNELYVKNNITGMVDAKKVINWNNCNDLENLITNIIIGVGNHPYRELEYNYYNYVGRFTRD